MKVNTFRSMLEGLCCFSLPFFSVFLLGWGLGGGNILGCITGSCLNLCQFSIKDIFTNTVSVASAKHFVFTAIIHSFQEHFPHGFDVSETKNTISIHSLYVPSCPSSLMGGKRPQILCFHAKVNGEGLPCDGSIFFFNCITTKTTTKSKTMSIRSMIVRFSYFCDD